LLGYYGHELNEPFPSYRHLSVVAYVELELFLWPTVSRPVSLGIGRPFETLDQILPCSSYS
jgi:hypothetical protein